MWWPHHLEDWISIKSHDCFSIHKRTLLCVCLCVVYIRWICSNEMKTFPVPFSFRRRILFYDINIDVNVTLFIANICYYLKNCHKNAFTNYIYEQLYFSLHLSPFIDCSFSSSSSLHPYLIHSTAVCLNFDAEKKKRKAFYGFFFNCTLKAFMLIGLSRFSMHTQRRCEQSGI